jgi:hypothetical protein
MSLINDALKRASQSDRNRPRQPQPPGILRPVAGQGGFPLGLVLLAGVVLTLAAGGWLFWQRWHGSHLPASVKPTPIVETTANTEPSRGETETTSASEPSPSAPATSTASAGASSAVPQPSAGHSEQAWPADLKLAAIFFSKNNPMAMINGKTVGVGEVIEGISITKIERDQVSVEWNGQVKVLVMK